MVTTKVFGNLCEAPAALNVRELLASPSEVALKRARNLQNTTNSWYRHDDVPEFQDYLEQQTLGFWDDMAVLLHEDAETYSKFLDEIVFERPDLILEHPTVFGINVPVSDKKQLTDVFLSSYDNLSYYFTKLPDFYTETEKTRFADKIIGSEVPSEVPFNNACAALLYSAKPLEEKQKYIKETISQTPYVYMFKYLTRSPRNLQDWACNDDGNLLKSFESLALQKIISPEEVSDLLQRRYEVDLNLNASTEYQLGLLDAQLSLQLSGLISNAAPAIQLINQYAQECYALKNDLPTDELVGFVLAGIVDEKSVTDLVHTYPSHVKNVYDAQLTAKNKPYGAWPETEKLEHYDHSVIQELFKLFDGPKLPDINFNGLYQIFMYRGDDCKQEQLTMIDKLLATESEDALHGTFHINSILPAYKDDVDRLNRALKQNLIIKPNSFDFSTWKKWSEVLDYTKADVKSLFNLKLESQSSAFNMMNLIRDGLKGEVPLIDLSEAAAILHDALILYDTRDDDIAAITQLCRQKLGRDLSAKYFEEFATVEFPLIATMLNSKDGAYDSLDYYDLLTVASDVSSFPWLRNSKDINRFAEHCINTFAAEHLAYVLPLLWPLIDDELRQKGFLILSQNPALMEFELTSGWLNQALDSEAPKMITTGKPDTLSELAPKSFANFTRRRMKLAAHDTTGRQHLLTQYAYYYDLCEKADDIHNAASLVATLRGKNEQKNELRALEALVILIEFGGIKDAGEIADLTKTDLEEMCVASVAEQAGINDELAQSIVVNLQRQNIDLVKFSTWMRVSFRSQKQKAYLAPFMRHLGQNGTLADWKFNTEYGNNLDLSNEPELLTKWQSNHRSELTFSGDQAISINYSHDLEPMYLCGSRPSSNCLHYAYGSNQRGLLGLMNADSKMVTVNNHKDKPIGNAIIRIASHDGNLKLMVEPLYHSLKTSHEVAEMNRILIRDVEQYGKYLELPVAVIDANFGNITKFALQLWSEQEVTNGNVTIAQPKSPFTYSDAYGSGKRSIRVATVALANA